MIEALEKAFVISGEVDNENSAASGMLIYDFKNQTWDRKGTNWDQWLMGVANHLAFDDPSGGYILGFAGKGRQVSKLWHFKIAPITHTVSYRTIEGPNGLD